MAKYLNLYRISTYLLVIFFLSHTFGGMLSHASYGVAADGVFSLMKSIDFEVMGSTVTWGGMYLGFGLLFSVFLLFSADLTWHLGGLDEKKRAALLPVSWALFGAFVAVAVLGWVYFFIAPQITATVIAVLLGAACVKTARAGA
jgi:hypothetical protein